jgi:histidyl-tRNA synthetase
VISGDENFRLKKSLESASKIGAARVLIVGENEVNSGLFALKELSTGTQTAVTLEQLAQMGK